MNMITPNYLPMPIGPTVPQLEGPWDVARGREPVLPKPAPQIITLTSAVLSGYHGAKRNGGSIFWGVVWFALGAIFPVITPVIGAAQGFGSCKYNCRIGPATVMNGARRYRRK